MHAMVVHMKMSFFKIFSYFIGFYPNFQIFCPFLLFFFFFCCFWKIARMALLSRRGPGNIGAKWIKMFNDVWLLRLFKTWCLPGPPTTRKGFLWKFQWIFGRAFLRVTWKDNSRSRGVGGKTRSNVKWGVVLSKTCFLETLM